MYYSYSFTLLPLAEKSKYPDTRVDQSHYWATNYNNYNVISSEKHATATNQI